MLLGPGLASPKDEIRGLDELSHHGHDDELGWFSGLGEAVGEGFEAGVEALCAEGCEVKHPARSGPAPGDEAHALVLPGVAVEGGDAQKRGGLPALHGPQFRHADQQACGYDRAHARQAEQQAVAGYQVWLGLDPRKDVRRQLPGRGSGHE